MPLFSQRKGLKQVKVEIQNNSIDIDLTNKLWNLFKIYYLNKMDSNRIYDCPSLHKLFNSIWHFYFKKPIDLMPTYWEDLYKEIRTYFFTCEWYEVYDFLEFISNCYEDESNYYSEKGSTNEQFQSTCNEVLESELSAYRFVSGRITEVTSKEEIKEIESAINSPIKTVNTHLQNALSLLSDRKNPDYRNSIKESISAVEAVCKLIANNKDTTLGQALNIIEKSSKIEIHPKLKEAFVNLYHYTSDADGIRHSLKEDKVNLSFDEAKFMLVGCSAFVNYLISKSTKSGIKLNL